jgi:hypothetical protein
MKRFTESAVLEGALSLCTIYLTKWLIISDEYPAAHILKHEHRIYVDGSDGTTS